jgi:hypothetical protein
MLTIEKGLIFESAKTTPSSSSGTVFSESNLWLSALANSQFFNVLGYAFLPNDTEKQHSADG